jgi:hypothetical protein
VVRVVRKHTPRHPYHMILLTFLGVERVVRFACAAPLQNSLQNQVVRWNGWSGPLRGRFGVRTTEPVVSGLPMRRFRNEAPDGLAI